MKYILILIVGIVIGIVGECLIPEKYTINLSYGCWTSTSNPNLVFLPKLTIHNSTDNSFYPAYLSDSGSVKSYDVLFSIITNKLSRLNQQDCNQIKTKYLNYQEKKK